MSPTVAVVSYHKLSKLTQHEKQTYDLVAVDIKHEFYRVEIKSSLTGLLSGGRIYFQGKNSVSFLF